jgi:hypothetical protein
MYSVLFNKLLVVIITIVQYIVKEFVIWNNQLKLSQTICKP